MVSVIDLPQPAPAVESDAQRAALYRVLAHFLSNPPRIAELTAASGLVGDRSQLGEAIRRFADYAGAADIIVAGEQFQRLFIGLGGGELTPYASFYLTGSLHDRPLMQAPRKTCGTGVRRAAGTMEPEVHAATVMEILVGLSMAGSTRIPTSHASFPGCARGHPGCPSSSRPECSRMRPLYAALGYVGVVFLQQELLFFWDRRSGLRSTDKSPTCGSSLVTTRGRLAPSKGSRRCSIALTTRQSAHLRRVPAGALREVGVARKWGADTLDRRPRAERLATSRGNETAPRF